MLDLGGQKDRNATSSTCFQDLASIPVVLSLVPSLSLGIIKTFSLTLICHVLRVVRSLNNGDWVIYLTHEKLTIGTETERSLTCQDRWTFVLSHNYYLEDQGYS